MPEQKRILTLEGNSSYKDFFIGQAEPKPEKLGVGPYILMYKNETILRKIRHGECRDELEKLVREKWNIDRRLKKLQDEFCEKWKLSGWPETA